MDALLTQKLLHKIRADYDTIAASFSETRGRAYDLQALTAEVKSGESVLDVGCGNGRLLDALPVGVHYTGCDVSERMRMLAENRSPIPLPNAQFVIGDVLSLPFPDASFHHVFALAVLHHIPSSALRQQAVCELARVVKPGGRVTMTVWNLRSWYWMRRYRLWRLLFGLYPKGYDRGDCLVPWKRGIDAPILRYVHAFTMRELRLLMQYSGFSVIHTSSRRNHLVVARRL